MGRSALCDTDLSDSHYHTHSAIRMDQVSTPSTQAEGPAGAPDEISEDRPLILLSNPRSIETAQE